MVVVADPTLVTGRTSGRLDPADQPGGREGTEGLVDRLERYVTDALTNSTGHFVRPGMRARADGFKDR